MINNDAKFFNNSKNNQWKINESIITQNKKNSMNSYLNNNDIILIQKKKIRNIISSI